MIPLNGSMVTDRKISLPAAGCAELGLLVILRDGYGQPAAGSDVTP